MQISPPYLMFLGDVPDQLAAKTAQGIVDWRPDWCLGQWRLPRNVVGQAAARKRSPAARDATLLRRAALVSQANPMRRKPG